MAPHPPPLKQSSITPFPLLFPSTQFSSPNNMLHSHLSLADHIGRRLNDSCGHAMNHVQNTTQNYANYMSLNTLEGTEYDSGASTPPLWRNSPSRSPPHRPNIDYRCLSPSSKAEAIARGQRELMEMVSKMPEACYELSLRDLVEHQPLAVESKQESFAERRGLINGEKGNKKKKQKNPKPQIKRSGSLDNGGFLLKMVLPISLGTNKKKKKKKNDCDANQNCKLSPKPTVLDASGKSVDKEWWKKRSGSNESESGGSTINSGSTRSIRSSSTSSSSSSCRSISNSSRSHKRGGCLAASLTLKGKDDNSAKSKRGRKVQFGTEGSPDVNFSSPKSDGKFATPFGKGGKGEKAANGGKTHVAKESQSLELRVEQELPENVKCLMDCEAASILEGIQDQMVILSSDPTIKLPESFGSGLQYAKTGSYYTNPQSVRKVLQSLTKYGVSNSEICVIANTCPETVDEVFALVRSLEAKRSKLTGPLKDVLDELAKLKTST